ncbi:MAG: hypothetical protein NTV30_08450 [Chloroflexi bacterium]|nr:hypothetical protein [Chloroflexota bacterium]
MGKEQELMTIISDPFRHRDEWEKALNVLAFLETPEAIKLIKEIEHDKSRPGWLRNVARHHLIEMKQYGR